MPVAWRPARFFVRLVRQAAVRSDTARRRLLWQAPMQPHCARLVVAGRRRDRDDPRNLSARASSSVEADARAMDHRVHVAGPPPLRQPVPVYTAAPLVKGGARTISMCGKRVKDFFQAFVFLAVIPDARSAIRDPRA